MALEELGVLTIIPPLLAIVMAIATRQVILSLLGGIWIGWVILSWTAAPQDSIPLLWAILDGTRDTVTALVAVFGEAWQTRVIIFTMLMGSLLILMQRSGGIEGFVRWVGQWQWAHSRRGAQLMAWVVGLGVFIESTITCLVVGTVSRPLFDRLKISREKLAYICDSTSAPVCIMLPINGWGATVLGLLGAQAALGNLGGESEIKIFLSAIPLNFYAIISVLLVLFVILTGWDIGPMRKAERRAREEGKVLRDGAMPVVDTEVIAIAAKEGVKPRLGNMMIPLLAMLIMVPVGIYITGRPAVVGIEFESIDAWLQALLGEASGSLSVLWAVTFAVAVAGILMFLQRIFTVQEMVDLSFKGAGGLVPLATIMVLAFAIGTVCSADNLNTGAWVAGVVSSSIPIWLIPGLVFLVACAIAFSTGTSWGTFAIMIPIAVPIAVHINADPALGALSIPLIVAAALGGGVFGDHCSPISDTSVVSSMAACSDHIDHVRTQIPYALIAAALTFVIYVILGFTGAMS